MLGGYFREASSGCCIAVFAISILTGAARARLRVSVLLVEKLGADSATVTLVNTDQVNPDQCCGAGGRLRGTSFSSAVVDGKEQPIDQAFVNVRLEPGSGSRIEFKMKRYANQPTLAQPWARGNEEP